jgi:hypothetical protein
MNGGGIFYEYRDIIVYSIIFFCVRKKLKKSFCFTWCTFFKTHIRSSSFIKSLNWWFNCLPHLYISWLISFYICIYLAIRIEKRLIPYSKNLSMTMINKNKTEETNLMRNWMNYNDKISVKIIPYHSQVYRYNYCHLHRQFVRHSLTQSKLIRILLLG